MGWGEGPCSGVPPLWGWVCRTHARSGVVAHDTTGTDSRRLGVCGPVAQQHTWGVGVERELARRSSPYCRCLVPPLAPVPCRPVGAPPGTVTHPVRVWEGRPPHSPSPSRNGGGGDRCRVTPPPSPRDNAGTRPGRGICRRPETPGEAIRRRVAGERIPPWDQGLPTFASSPTGHCHRLCPGGGASGRAGRMWPRVPPPHAPMPD